MFDNDLLVKIMDKKITVEGKFEDVRKAIEVLKLSGSLRKQDNGFCCYDCDGHGFREEIAVVQDGRIWPTTSPTSEPIKGGPERTLRTRNVVNYLANYMPGSSWPGQQRFFRREGRRAQRRFGKAIVAEAMMELD